MPQHGSAHKEMVIYADLMLWLKSTDPAVFSGLATVYTENLSRLYTREVSEFLESARQRLLSKEAKGKHSEQFVLFSVWCGLRGVALLRQQSFFFFSFSVVSSFNILKTLDTFRACWAILVFS